jgi:hypothetical protein
LALGICLSEHMKGNWPINWLATPARHNVYSAQCLQVVDKQRGVVEMALGQPLKKGFHPNAIKRSNVPGAHGSHL